MSDHRFVAGGTRRGGLIVNVVNDLKICRWQEVRMAFTVIRLAAMAALG